jgi:hypothetical protein
MHDDSENNTTIAGRHAKQTKKRSTMPHAEKNPPEA